jgi:hypothetical protein
MISHGVLDTFLSQKVTVTYSNYSDSNETEIGREKADGCIELLKGLCCTDYNRAITEIQQNLLYRNYFNNAGRCGSICESGSVKGGR